MINQILGERYRIKSLIGEGGMAAVYSAVDEKLQRKVAIKILHSHLAKRSEIRARFNLEARSLSGINHPNIINIYDFSGIDSDDLWIVTEILHGVNLAQYADLSPTFILHPLIATFIVSEVCKALDEAHSQGIVHRDIKPENVMVLDSGRIKLMDFGISKDIHQKDMTMTGTFMGSPSYMSPEQIRGRDVNHRSDLYSLAVLYYEIVTGTLPFSGGSAAEVTNKIMIGKFSAPRNIKTSLPLQINEFIIKGMQHDPEIRFESAQKMRDVLSAFTKQLGFDESHIELERYFNEKEKFELRIKNLFRSEARSRPLPVAPKPAFVRKKNKDEVKKTIISPLGIKEKEAGTAPLVPDAQNIDQSSSSETTQILNQTFCLQTARPKPILNNQVSRALRNSLSRRNPPTAQPIKNRTTAVQPRAPNHQIYAKKRGANNQSDHSSSVYQAERVYTNSLFKSFIGVLLVSIIAVISFAVVAMILQISRDVTASRQDEDKAAVSSKLVEGTNALRIDQDKDLRKESGATPEAGDSSQITGSRPPLKVAPPVTVQPVRTPKKEPAAETRPVIKPKSEGESDFGSKAVKTTKKNSEVVIVPPVRRARKPAARVEVSPKDNLATPKEQKTAMGSSSDKTPGVRPATSPKVEAVSIDGHKAPPPPAKKDEAGRLFFSSNQQPANVLVDGKPRGNTYDRSGIKLFPGNYIIELKRDDIEGSVKSPVTIKPGESTHLPPLLLKKKIRLVPLVILAANVPLSVRIQNTNTGHIRNEVITKIGRKVIRLKSGNYTVTIKYEDHEITRRIRLNSELVFNAEFKQER